MEENVGYLPSQFSQSDEVADAIPEAHLSDDSESIASQPFTVLVLS